MLAAKDGDLIPCNSLGASALSTPYGKEEEEDDEDDESVLSGLAPTLCVLGAVCVASNMPR